ncbi:MAG: DUF4230 domain-containing protein [Pseudomonadota bacterium]
MEDGGVSERGGSNGCLKALVLGVLILAALGAGFWYLGDSIVRRITGAPDPVTVATSSLQSLREQNRLSTFSARYVAVVTSTQTRLGLSAKKTLIMPGSVSYEVDLSKLNQNDLSWDASANRLSIVLPPVEVTRPNVDIDQIREYGEGGILMAVTDAEAQIDAANRKAGQAELVRQAGEATPMRMARDATRRAIARSFEMPLRAAGLNATVEVTFADEGKANRGEVWDRSRRPDEVMNDTAPAK